MIRMILAAAAVLALAFASPALACPNCHDCPAHGDKVASADKAEKKDAEKKPACACAAEGKECKCGDKCQCPHCHAKHAQKKDEGKKS